MFFLIDAHYPNQKKLYFYFNYTLLIEVKTEKYTKECKVEKVVVGRKGELGISRMRD
jgi:hypothetical protein